MFALVHKLAIAFGSLFRRKRQFEAEMDDEISFHFEQVIEANIKAGMTPWEARRAARLSFGGVDQIKEECRDTRPTRIIREAIQDLRYGLRTLAKSPGFAVVSILTLGLGVGANTAIFSLMDAILLKDLPVPNPEELVIIEAFHGEKGRDFSYPVFRDIAARQEAFSGIFATGGAEFVRVGVEGVGEVSSPEMIQSRFVSSNYFSVLGVNPILGRVFNAGDDQEAVIGYGFWQRQFGKDPSVLGRVITLNQASFVIVGVTGRDFYGESPGNRTDFWIPIEAQPRTQQRNLLEARTASWFRTMARLKPGVAPGQAQAALTVLYRHLLADEIASGTGSLIHKPPRLEDTRVGLSPGSKGHSWHRRQLSQPLRLLMQVVAVVLLIACCNVANLLLARASFRQKEIGIRLALGAARLRLVRQLLTESLLLAAMGGAAGVGLFFATRHVFLTMASLQLDLRPDWRILGFAAAVALLTGLLFGLVPALQATKMRVVPSGQIDSAGHSRILVPRLLVVVQMALSMVLLVGAGLLVRTLLNFRDFDPGFVRENVLLFELEHEDSSETATDRGLGGVILERLSALPAVHSASLCDSSFFSGSANTSPVRVPDSEVNPDADGEIRTERVSPRYFETLGMRLLMGREFTPADNAVAIINSALARHYFPGQNPLGKPIYLPRLDEQRRYIPFSPKLELEQAVEIVGVVQDAKYDDLRQVTPRMAYLPWVPGPSFDYSSVVVRTVTGPATLVKPIRATLRQINPKLMVREVKTLEDQVNQSLAHERLITELLTFFGLLALALACVGLYGLMSYSVARRTREIGIRMALGARRIDALAMVLKGGLTLGVTGIVLGLPGVLIATRLVEHFLFGVRPFDPATIAMAVALLLFVSLTAGYVPAYRAARVDPALTLRED